MDTIFSTRWSYFSIPRKYKNRGNGSLRFIESFYNLKGCNASKLSKMTLQSGKANIVFDGKYPVTESMVKTKNIESLHLTALEILKTNLIINTLNVASSFPGTFIHAYIYL